MTKYYVESGPHFLFVIQASDRIAAIVKALEMSGDTLRLADVLIVNERGFVWNRENHQLRGDELVLPTRLVLGMPEVEEELPS
jgi:hypothetical protein